MFYLNVTFEYEYNRTKYKRVEKKNNTNMTSQVYGKKFCLTFEKNP